MKSGRLLLGGGSVVGLNLRGLLLGWATFAGAGSLEVVSAVLALDCLTRPSSTTLERFWGTRAKYLASRPGGHHANDGVAHDGPGEAMASPLEAAAAERGPLLRGDLGRPKGGIAEEQAEPGEVALLPLLAGGCQRQRDGQAVPRCIHQTMTGC